jgi:hypothetical protein
VVLAVDGDPRARRSARVDPQPETAEMPYDGMQIAGAVRLIAMEVQRHANECDLHPHERYGDVAPKAQVQQAVHVIEEKIHAV